MKKIIIFLSSSVICLNAFAQQPLDTLRMDELRKSTVLSVDEVIAGRIPGVNVSFSDDSPGRMADYSFRGVGSDAPLFVVDGFRVDQAYVQAMNPAQIESIVVLTDIAATSLYGSQGCAGVIEITTKKGQQGKVKVEADATLGASLPSTASLAGTDYVSGAVSSALLQKYNVSVSGGSSVAGNRFFANIGYISDKGVLKGAGNGKFQASLSYDQKLARNVRFHLGASYRINTIDGIATDTPYCDYMMGNDAPIPYYGPDSYIMYYVMGKGDTDPVSTLENAYSSARRSYVTGDVGLDWNIVEGLDFIVRGAYSALNTDEQTFNNKKTIYGAPGSRFGMNVNSSYIANSYNRYDAEALFSYSKTFSNSDALRAKAGFFAGGVKDSFRGERTYNMTTEALGTAGLSTGTYIPVPIFDAQYSHLQAYACVTYSIKGHVDVFANLSADTFNGTEKGGWKFLPSVGAAWNFVKLCPAGGVLSSGKLSASWGKVGSTLPYEYTEGVYFDSRVASQIDASLSAGFWKDRLTAKIGFYDISIDEKKYDGIELSLNAYPVKNDKVQWCVYANTTLDLGESHLNWGGAGTVLEVSGFDFGTHVYWNPTYFRCSNITAGYTFSRNLLKVFSMRVFANAGNLCHKSIYKDFDFSTTPATSCPGRFSLTGGVSFEF